MNFTSWLSVTAYVILFVLGLALLVFSCISLCMKNRSNPVDLLSEQLQQVQVETNRLTRRSDGGDEQEEVVEEDDERAIRLLSHIQQTSHNTSSSTSGVRVGTGRGIVICAGGFEYGTCAHILLTRLRETGCTLPVELWYRDGEMSDEMANHFSMNFSNIRLRNIDQVASISIPSRFAIKPLSVLHSEFQQVLLLDADVVPLADPTYLFDILKQTVHEDSEQPCAAVFWPDNWRLDRKAKCFSILTTQQQENMTYRNAQDGGQILIDKSISMAALSLCTRINVQLAAHLKSLFPGPYNHGDKDTWHFSFLATDTEFLMMPERPGGAGIRDGKSGQYIGNSMVHYDHQENPIFLHKCYTKWAEQGEHPQWSEYVKFMKDRGSVDEWTYSFDGGPIYRTLFSEVFGDLDERCWEALTHLREQPWYKQEFKHKLEIAKIIT